MLYCALVVTYRHVTAPYKLTYYYYYYTNQHCLCLYHQCSTTVNSGACFYQTHLEEVKLQKHSEEHMYIH